ncbi:unnamed protein product [Calypogeia fissa]
MGTIPMVQKAWLYKEYGPKEVLSFGEDVKVPKPAPDQVLVKVHAASLNPIDTHRRFGVYGKIGVPDSPLPTVPGFDLAGVVVKLGSGVSKFKVGDKVYSDVNKFAMRNPKQYGTFAEYCAVEERLVAHIPENLSFAEAASLPASVETAYQALELAGLQEGGNVLILGGAGGGGSVVVQLAKHVFKAAKVATTSTPKGDFLEGLGAGRCDRIQEGRSERPSGQVRYRARPGGKGGDYAHIEGEWQGRFVQWSSTTATSQIRGDVQCRNGWAYLDSGRATGKLVISPIP